MVMVVVVVVVVVVMMVWLHFKELSYVSLRYVSKSQSKPTAVSRLCALQVRDKQ